MIFARLPNKKQLLAVGFLTGLMLLVVPVQVSAQQQTGQITPQTRNPQTSTPELFEQREDLQSAGSHQLLTQPRKIEIPRGTPAAPETENTRASGFAGNKLAIVLLAIGATAVAITIILIVMSKWTDNKSLTTALTEVPQAEEVPQPVFNKKADKGPKKKRKAKGKPRPKKR